MVAFDDFVDVFVVEVAFFIGDDDDDDDSFGLDCTTDSLDHEEISLVNSCRWPGVIVPSESEPSGRMFRDKWYSVS